MKGKREARQIRVKVYSYQNDTIGKVEHVENMQDDQFMDFDSNPYTLTTLLDGPAFLPSGNDLLAYL